MFSIPGFFWGAVPNLALLNVETDVCSDSVIVTANEGMEELRERMLGGISEEAWPAILTPYYA